MVADGREGRPAGVEAGQAEGFVDCGDRGGDTVSVGVGCGGAGGAGGHTHRGASEGRPRVLVVENGGIG